jgi:acetolactate synthase-1/3 small subunit
MKRIYSILVENRAGVLCKTAGLFWRRCFNIDSITVGETDDRKVSSMVIVSSGDERTLEQIEKQLNKKINIIKVRRLSEVRSIVLEMMLVKVNCSPTTRASIIEVCQVTGARIMKVAPKYLMLEYHDDPEGIQDFISLIKPFGILEIQKTGAIAMEKG